MFEYGASIRVLPAKDGEPFLFYKGWPLSGLAPFNFSYKNFIVGVDFG
ncbi:MAG: hypothetical protein H3Z53_08515 [archaeon]|nr:hypothetical protein [archaeon]MCP8317765.1 hypothetical protein [archaeon]MCP8320457.1 hypothetical protein [archaeon]